MIGCDYNFFRGDIEPLWEVKENKDGGRLIVQVFIYFARIESTLTNSFEGNPAERVSLKKII